uniref:Methyltransferase domain-containing protein n=1 Tax=Biomphalaria glabrata TaxID=6526 RepID=A0A2C9JWP8_BIOGL
MTFRNSLCVYNVLLFLCLVLVTLYVNQQRNMMLIRLDAYETKQGILNKVTRTVEDLGSGPLMSLREKGIVDSLVGLDLDSLSNETLLITLHSNLDNLNSLCRRKLRLGDVSDGGWEICDDADVRPREPCIIYSFGINYDFSFDEAAAALYGCHVFSFDPSMNLVKDQFDRSPKVHFSSLGLSGQSFINKDNWTMLTLKEIRRRLGHKSSSIDVIKMDVEGSEWQALPEMIQSGELPGNVKQVLLEYHLGSTLKSVRLAELKVVKNLERIGFKKFYVHKNPFCRTIDTEMPSPLTNCYEVSYLRR